MKARIEFRSGEVRHGMYVDGRPQKLPASLAPGPYETTVLLAGVEYDGGSEVDRITREVVEKVGQVLDGTSEEHAQAARDLLAQVHFRESEWRATLLTAAANLLHAIHRIDKTRPIEVRADDVRAALEIAWTYHDAPTVTENQALSRLRDALEGPR